MRHMSQHAKSTKPPPLLTVPLLELKRQYQTLAAEIIPIVENICAISSLFSADMCWNSKRRPRHTAVARMPSVFPLVLMRCCWL